MPRIPRTKSSRWELPALVAFMVVSLPWFVGAYFETTWDAVLYVLTTRSLLSGNGYAVFGDPFHLRPPGFSLMLAPVMAAFGDNVLVWNLFVSLLGICALALAFVYFRPRLGRTLSLAVCAALWLNPQYQSVCNTVLSDTAGLATLFGCLLLDRWARKREGFARDLALGAALAWAGYLRTIALALIPAIGLARWCDRRTAAGALPPGRKIGRVALLFALPLLMHVPWVVWKARHPAPVPSQQHGIYSYWTAQWHTDTSDPRSDLISTESFLKRVQRRSRECVTSLGSRMPRMKIRGFPPVEKVERLRAENRRPLGLPLGCIGVASLIIVTWRRRDAGDFFALATLGLLLIYFGFDDRLLIPNFLFVLAATLECLLWVLRRWITAQRAVVLATLLVVAMGLSDAFPPPDRRYLRQQDRTLRAVARWVEERYPPGTPVGGSLGHRLAVFFDEPVYFLEIAAHHRGQEGVLEVMRDRKLKVVVDTGEDNGPRLRSRLDPILEQRARVVQRIDDVTIYELREPAGP